ncbi:alpha/beta hydrolase [Silvibacterium acidisoli]|uniref:alpha/beta hydrolase n=1 Tax=Acidobacteriaceae bacterium ZG23-2 TaxID=2883246 RepID=UPI00406D3FAA
MQLSLKTIDDLRGPAGRLEALLNTGAADAPFAVLVCHPHPLGGGTMHNKVVYHTMKAFQSLGLPVLRFNFRGTGLSEGAYDHARGEQEDTRAALDWLEREYGLPMLLAGFSFGSYVGLRVACTDDRVKAVVGLGLPVHAEGRDYRYEFLAECHKPKLFISGTQDQYGPKAMVEAEVQQAAPPTQMVWIEGAEHFFVGRLDEVRDAITHWCRANVLAQVAQ